MQNYLSRRKLALGVVGAGGGLLLASCSQQPGEDVAAKIAAILTAIQKGVKDGCATAGTVIPTANSVIAVIGAMFSGVHPAVLTGVQIAQVVSAFVEQACAAPVTDARRARVEVKGVPVEFY